MLSCCMFAGRLLSLWDLAGAAGTCLRGACCALGSGRSHACLRAPAAAVATCTGPWRLLSSLCFVAEDNTYDEYENSLGITATALYDYQAGRCRGRRVCGTRVTLGVVWG